MVQTAGGHLGESSAASEQDEEEPRKDGSSHYMSPDWNKLLDWSTQPDLCAVSMSDRHTFSHRYRSPGIRLGTLASPTHPESPGKTKGEMSSEKKECPELSLDHAIKSIDRCAARPLSERLSGCPSSEEL